MSLQKTFKHTHTHTIEVIRHLVLRKIVTEIQIKDLLASQGTRDSFVLPYTLVPVPSWQGHHSDQVQRVGSRNMPLRLLLVVTEGTACLVVLES